MRNGMRSLKYLNCIRERLSRTREHVGNLKQLSFLALCNIFLRATRLLQHACIIIAFTRISYHKIISPLFKRIKVWILALHIFFTVFIELSNGRLALLNETT